MYHIFRQHEFIVRGQEVLFYFQLAAADMYRHLLHTHHIQHTVILLCMYVYNTY
jgi:hypothetical protein